MRKEPIHRTGLGIRLFVLAIICLLVATAHPLRAGGPLGATGTVPHKYPAGAFPLSYKYDQGALGNFSNNIARSIADYAFSQWDNVPSAALTFTNAGQLPRNVTSNTDSYISGVDQFNDGVNPVIFDSDGSITDDRFGTGAKSSVYGFSASASAGTTLLEGFVIINGYLSGSGTAADEDIYKAVITHEVGHFLGLGHSQVGMHGVFVTMYPSVESDEQRTLEAEDKAEISLLYPTQNFPSSVGAISGTVKSPSNAILSGVNVVAVDSATGDAYSTLVDYYSGGGPTFASPPTATGSYTIRGLPPGRYAVRIEPLRPEFTGGSSVASYTSPINTSIAREWYNGGAESGDMLLDNTNEMVNVPVTAGNTYGGVNFISNESSTLSTISYHKSTPAASFLLPITSVDGYATRFTAPSDGSLLGMRLEFISGSDMPIDGMLTVSVYTNVTGSLAGIPGTSLGSVTIPFKYLAAGQPTEVWLRELGAPINFSSGADFHIVVSSNNIGALEFYGDDGTTTQNRTSYRLVNGVWRNYPQGGFNAGFNMMMTAVWTTSTAGNPQPAISAVPSTVDFGRKRPGQSVDKTVRIGNPGTAPLDVTGTTIAGPAGTEFAIVSGGGPFSLARGETRDIVIRFSPQTASGAKSATLSIASNAPTAPTSIPLNGSGVQPSVEAKMAEIDFGPRKIGVATTIDTVIIHNGGNDTLHISSLKVTGPDSTILTLVGSTGAVKVLPNTDYKVRLRFTPSEHRAYSATLRLVHDDASGESSFLLKGQGVAAAVKAGDDTLAFGGVRVGASVGSSGYYIENIGDAPLTISSIGISGTDASAFSLVSPTTFPVTLEPGQQLPIEVRFSPDARRFYLAFLRIDGDADPAQNLYPMTGHGSGAILRVPGTFSLGRIGVDKPAVADLMVRNVGDESLNVTGLTIEGESQVDFTLVNPPVGPGSPASIAPGDSMPVRIRFQSATMGSHTAVLTIEHDADGSPTQVTLDAMTTDGAMELSANILDFGDVNIGSSYALRLVVRNAGSVPLTLTSYMIDGGEYALLDPPTVDPVLAVGDSVVVIVRFAPEGTGTRLGTLYLGTDGSVADTLVRVVLVGYGQGVSGVDAPTVTTGTAAMSLSAPIPNPARDRVRVDYRVRGGAAVPFRLLTTDASGRRVVTPIEGVADPGDGSFSIDLSDLPSGDYFLTLRTPEGTMTRRVVVVR